MSYPVSVYDGTLINQAIKDYGTICCISCSRKEDEIICTFSRSVADLELTALEFSNYLIELANVRMRA